MDRPVRAQRSGEHPGQRNSPDVAVRRGVHHFGGEGALRVGGELARVVPLGIGELREFPLQGRGESAHDPVEDFRESDAGQRTDESRELLIFITPRIAK